MDAKETLNKVRSILGLEVILEEKLLENGTKFVAEKFEGGNEVFIKTEDDEKIPVPAGEYLMDDGVVLYVKEDGVIDSMGEEKKEEEEEEEMKYDDKEEMAEETELEDDGKEADVEDWAGMEKRIKNLEDAVADLKREHEEMMQKEELSSEVVEESNEEVVEELQKEELSEAPKQIKHNPEANKEIELTKIGKVSDLRQRVFNQIFSK
jgi:hypothetical protein